MKTTLVIGVALSFMAAGLLAQTVPNSVDAHIAAAKAAAGTEHVSVFNSLCMATEERASSNPAPTRAATTPAPSPDRAKWHSEPVKVFDNLYYLGQSEYSAWAVNTSAGIIVIDALFDYSVEDEVVNGLTKLGLDPKNIKYVIISHAHSDHVTASVSSRCSGTCSATP